MGFADALPILRRSLDFQWCQINRDRLSSLSDRGRHLFLHGQSGDRHRTLLTEHIGLLRDAFRAVKKAHPFDIDAMVVLPDHLHAIWTLPQGDHDFSLRWRQIKAAFSVALDKEERISRSRARKQERGIWQRRFWEHAIRDEPDFKRHVDYIHHNPVKHGYVPRVMDWPYSSFHRYVRQGILPSDWAGMAIEKMELE
jgi:putative transposase